MYTDIANAKHDGAHCAIKALFSTLGIPDSGTWNTEPSGLFISPLLPFVYSFASRRIFNFHCCHKRWCMAYPPTSSDFLVAKNYTLFIFQQLTLSYIYMYEIHSSFLHIIDIFILSYSFVLKKRGFIWNQVRIITRSLVRFLSLIDFFSFCNYLSCTDDYLSDTDD